MKSIILSPSILSANFFNLEKDLAILKKNNIARLHLDIMDGNFVPNISFGPDLIKSLKKHSDFFLETHLMIKDPLKYIKVFKEAGSDIIIFHIESTKNIEELINEIKKLNIKVGISIKPKTSWIKIKEFLLFVDMILVMSVEPGFSGQKYIPEITKKIKLIDKYIKKQNLNIDIGVDGGINKDTILEAILAGANIIIAGSSVFSENSSCIRKNILNLSKFFK